MELLDLLKKYAFEKMSDNNGLLLLPMSTGSGKSYTVFKFIHDAITNNRLGEKGKIIFVTSLKKNIDEETLRKMFTPSEEHLMAEKIITIKSFVDCVLDNFQFISKKRIHPSVFKSKEYTCLKTAVDYCNRSKDNKTKFVQDTIKEYQTKIKDKLEPEFRNKIKRILFDEFKYKNVGKSYSKRLDYILDERNNWRWLLDIYPQIQSKEKQVFLMSMDKFLYRNDPIIEKGYYIYKDLAKDAIVFIDEFDSTKDIMLKHLIDDAVKSQIDYIIAYQSIFRRFHQGNFPLSMTHLSDKQKNKDKDILKNHFKRCEKNCMDLYNKLGLDYQFKLDEKQGDEISKTFLFQDINNITISNNKDQNKKLFFVKDEDEQLNIISYKDGNFKGNDFVSMIAKVRNFLKFFAGCVEILALNLLKIKGDEFGYEDAIKSVLDQFFQGVDNRIKDHFLNEILLYRKNQKDREEMSFDGSFFENGFSYCAIEDDDEHFYTSSIRMTELPSTPEKILVDICKNSKVFGISATADFDTVIGNYALNNYVIDVLRNQYYELSKDELDILRTHFNKSISNYQNVNINVEKVECNNYSQDTWNGIFSDEDNAEEIYNSVSQVIHSGEKNNFSENRFVKLAIAFKKFIEIDDIKSMLCFLNKFPNDGDFHKDLLGQIFNLLSKQCGKDLDFDKNVVIIRSGHDYELNKESLVSRLSDGEKILVISTYQTIGAGQNLQYDIPKGIKTVPVNDNNSSKSQKDFDAIYLESPTNLYTLISNDDITTFIRFIVQLQYLKEIGELSYKDCKAKIKDAFRKFFYDKNFQLYFSFKHFDDYKQYATLKIIQAVGRICRTKNKNPNVYIFFDDELSGVMDCTVQNKLLNPEFVELLKKIKENRQEQNYKSVKEKNLAVTKSEEANNRIIRYVSNGRNGWKQDAINEWQSIREFVLQHPTISKEEYRNCDNLYKPFYIQMPKPNNKIWYKREGDYKDLDISFEYQDGWECVSDESARLQMLIKHTFIKDMFEFRKFRTSFNVDDYIICPPVFSNIYKGALGEYVGKEILNQFGIELEEISALDLFELFDYKVKGKNIYIDFKHWNEYSKFLPKDEDVKQHIDKKLAKCNGEKAFIINIIAEQKHKIINDGRIVEIPYLLDSSNGKYNQEAISLITNCINE